MISRGFEVYGPIKNRYRTVDPDMFIERLKRLRALDPEASKFDSNGRRLKEIFKVFVSAR